MKVWPLIVHGDLDADGSHVWTRTFGGGGFDKADDVATDAVGNIFVVGEFRRTVDFDPGPGVDLHTALNTPIDVDIFVTKLYADGSYAWTWTFPVFFKGQVAVDADGAVITTGSFGTTVDFDPTEGVDLRTPGPPGQGDSSLFVMKLNGDGSYAWTYTGGGGVVGGDVLAAAPNGDVIVSGYYGFNEPTVDFAPGEAVAEHTCESFRCEFLLRLREDGSFAWVRTTENMIDFTRRAMHIDADSNIFLGRNMHRTTDLDPNCGLDVREPDFSGAANPYLTKFICSALPGDFDRDGDVDLFDVARMQTCFAGERPLTCAPGCDAFNLDGQDSIALPDFAAFAPLLTGPQ